MLTTITDFWNQRVYGKHYQDLFQEISNTITGEYIEDIFLYIEKNGAPPSFEEIMRKVKTLSTELTMRAEWIRENYKEGKGYRSIKLTTGCKRIIKKAMEEYMRQAKSVHAIRSQRDIYLLEMAM
jgi:hypothetical protein